MTDHNIKNNPLLAGEVFHRFDLIKPEHFVPAVEHAIKESKVILEKIKNLKEPRTFANTMQQGILMNEIIGNVVAPMSQLFALMATPEVLFEYQKSQQILTTFSNETSMDEKYYQAIKEYAATEEAKSLNTERKRHLEIALRGFRLGGGDLPEDKKVRLKEINLEQSKLGLDYQNNITNSTFNLVITDKKDLEGLTEDTILGAAAKAKDLKLENSYVFNLDMPSYLPFMKYSKKSDLKKELWTKYITRATAEGKDNRPLIKDIIRLRKEKAQLLGFKSFGELSLETKMANSPDEVMTFLDSIATKTVDIAAEEMAEVATFRKEAGCTDQGVIMPWDFGYWSKELKEQKYAFNEEQTREYFEINKCIEGLFSVTKEIFGLSFYEDKDLPVWHKDVRTYAVLDEKKAIRAYIFFDLHPRTSLKRPGAWMSQLVSSKMTDKGRVPAQVVVSCNFTEAVGDTPALLTYSEVVTLFHEFGHALHGALSLTELSSMAGTSVPWDVVELPSTFMENFTRQKESLRLFAHHYKTGEVIPDELLSKIIAADDFMKAVHTRTQISYGMFDMSLHHTELLKENLPDAHEVNRVNHQKYNSLPYVEDTYFEAGFAHIFAGGYAAGYYSYLWANILEADAFSAFEENGKILDRNIGRRYMENILEMGNSQDMYVSFEKFRGRPVSDKALLKRLGIK